MTKAMKRLAVLAITSTLGLLPQGASAQSCNWPAWDSYKKAMMSSDGRIIDGSSAQMITTSEGQSYGLFFALLGNDKKSFATILEWTRNNLAGGSLEAHLPAWQWGLAKNGKWQILDSNNASDADLLVLGQMAPDLRDNPDLSVLLQRQRDMLVQPHGTSGIDANNRRTPSTDARNVPANKVEVTAQAPIAAILGMQSPTHNQRSVVALLANDDADYNLLREVLSDSGKLDAVAGSAALIRSSGVYSQLVGDQYFVGNLPWYLLLWYQLSEHPVLLTILAVISVLLSAFLLWRALSWAANRRLHKHD